MKIEEYMDEWRKDTDMSSPDLASAALAIPRLHHKWSEYLTKERMRLLKLKSDQEKLEMVLDMYYGKELTTEELEQYGLPSYPDKKILKPDIPRWVNNHKDMVEIKLRIGLAHEKIEYLKDILKSIHNRGYVIKTAVDYRKFEAGG